MPYKTKEEQRAWAARYRKNNVVKIRAWRKKHQDRKHKEHRAWLAALKVALGCVDCGYKENHLALDFDHVRGVKKMNLSCMGMHNRNLVFEELAKCDVRCANCHRIKTHDT